LCFAEPSLKKSSSGLRCCISQATTIAERNPVLTPDPPTHNWRAKLVRIVVACEIGTTANQKKLFFKLGSAKHKISVLGGGDLHPDQVTLIAKSLNFTEQDVVDMNRRLIGDTSINAQFMRKRAR